MHVSELKREKIELEDQDFNTVSYGRLGYVKIQVPKCRCARLLQRI